MAIAFRLCLLNLPTAIKKNVLSKYFKKLASLAYFLTDVGKKINLNLNKILQ